MNLKCPLPCSQKTAIASSSEPIEFSLHSHTYLISLKSFLILSFQQCPYLTFKSFLDKIKIKYVEVCIPWYLCVSTCFGLILECCLKYKCCVCFVNLDFTYRPIYNTSSAIWRYSILITKQFTLSKAVSWFPKMGLRDSWWGNPHRNLFSVHEH